MEKIKKYYPTLRCIYLCALVAYTVLREIIPLQIIVGHILFTAAFFGVGILVILADYFLDKAHSVKANVGLLIAFLGVSCFSTLINFKYELFSNIKAIAWMVLLFLFVYPSGFHQKARGNKELTAICATAIITLSIGTLLSLPMYFCDIHYTYVTDSAFDNVLPQGFHKKYMRLWGIFSDPNTASVYSFAALLMSIYLFKKKKNVCTRILLVIADVTIVLFVVLSGSRTAKVVLIVTGAWLAFYSFYTQLQKRKNLQRIIVSCASSALAAIIVFLGLSGLSAVLPYARRGINAMVGENVVSSVHKLYDDVYEKTSLNIVDGFWEAATPDEEDVPSVGGDESINRPDLDGREDISNGRFEKWNAYLQIFSFAPIFGASPRGISAFGKVHCPDNQVSQYGYFSHNTLLEVLTATGLVGELIVLIILFFAAFFIIRKALRERFDFTYLIQSSLILSLIVSSMFISDLFFNLTFGGVAFWFAMGYINGEEKYITEEDLARQFNDGKKRILIYGPNDPVGGVEKIVYEYVKAIVEAHPDVAFDFLQCGREFSMEKELTDLGCRVLYVPSRMRHYFKYKIAVEKIFADNRYTAVWGNYSGLTNIDLLVLAKQYHVPVRIAHSHNCGLTWGNKIMKYVVILLHYYNKFRICDYATDFWVCSILSGRFMFPKKEYDRLQVVHNAVDLKKFYPDEEERWLVRTQLGIPKDALVIGHVARLCEVKNQSFLLNVAKATTQLNDNTLLLLVGDGELRAQLQEEAASLNILDKVVFLGEREDVPNLLRAMDVFVLTSISEGLSVSAIEAQASGLPCVLPTSVAKETDVSGLVKFVSLEEPYSTWAQAVLEQRLASVVGAREKLADSGYEISVEAEKVYKAFVLAE